MWHDRSPAILAVLGNLAIAAIGWGGLAIGTFIVSHNLYLCTEFMLGLAIANLLTLMYTIGAHQLALQARINNSGIVPTAFITVIHPINIGIYVYDQFGSTYLSKHRLHRLTVLTIFLDRHHSIITTGDRLNYAIATMDLGEITQFFQIPTIKYWRPPSSRVIPATAGSSKKDKFLTMTSGTFVNKSK